VTTSVLNDKEKICAVDKSGMINFCIDAPKHYRAAEALAQKIKVKFTQPDNIIIAGMGGSAIGGDITKDYVKEKLNVPIEVVRDYHLPAYAGKKTLVVAMSYSGDTEETLSAFLDALKRGCMIFCITSGGALAKYARKHKVPYIQVPNTMPPRAALPYMLVPLLVFMEKIGLIKGVSEELEETFALLDKVCAENGIDQKWCDSPAKEIAQHIGDAAPAIYGFGSYRAVAQRFKQQFNENAKTPAKWEYFPELDHNEVVGWQTSGELNRYFTVIFIRDIDNEPTEIESRIDTTKAINTIVELLEND
jgi:glucose/mannose-6-phosphate isomerase